jgi:autoinducer 2-degrading protein
MYVTIVHVDVKPEHIHDFIEASRLNHETSVMEPGNKRFDVLQLQDDTTKFILYEAYTSPEAAAARKETAHYIKWRDSITNWMANQRQGIVYEGLFPE